MKMSQMKTFIAFSVEFAKIELASFFLIISVNNSLTNETFLALPNELGERGRGKFW